MTTQLVLSQTSEILEISKPIDNNLGTALGMYIELEKSKILIKIKDKNFR